MQEGAYETVYLTYVSVRVKSHFRLTAQIPILSSSNDVITVKLTLTLCLM